MLKLLKREKIPTEAIRIPLTRGLFAYISPQDYILVSRYKWRAVKSFSKYYARTSIKICGKSITFRMHRIIMDAQAWEKVHHINHNTLDNRRENLQAMSECEFRKIDGAHVFFEGEQNANI